MALPSVVLKRDGLGTKLTGFLCRRIPGQSLVNAQVIVILTIEIELSLPIRRIPIEELVQILGSYASNQSFHKRMRPRDKRDRLDGFDTQNPGLRCLNSEMS
jgi:hypothetical protein